MSTSMYNFFTGTVSPDYNATLSVRPQRVLVEVGEDQQAVLRADDRSDMIISFSDNNDFYVSLQWERISEASAATIFDFFHDSSKANQYARSFKWTHPKDGHTYTVRFSSPLERGYLPGTYESISKIELHVLGIATLAGSILDSGGQAVEDSGGQAVEDNI